MMTRFLSASAAAIALLSACSSQDGEQSAPATEPTDAPAETGTLDAMPEDFRGHWDFAVENCGDPASVEKLEIGAGDVQFYESSAQLTAIERTGAHSLTVEHHFTGEGEEWDETLGYELSEDGDRLTVTTPEGSMSIRARCP